VTPPRLLADEMVGSLARFLRMVGCDTEYAHGCSDDEIVGRARDEHRTIVTRDRGLAARVAGSVLLSSGRLEDQVRETWKCVPALPLELSFTRCTLCNGELRAVGPEPGTIGQPGIPWDRVAAGLALYRCLACAHVYWDGTHTANVRLRLRRWVGGAE
jgi:uncharacterized protein